MVEGFKSVTMRFTPEQHKAIKILGAHTGLSIKDLVMIGLAKVQREYEEKGEVKTEELKT